MYKYSFNYSVKLPSGDCKELSFNCEAGRLSSAMKLFNRASKNFSYPVCFLNPRYSVVNESGKISFRFLPAKILDNLRVLSDD